MPLQDLIAQTQIAITIVVAVVDHQVEDIVAVVVRLVEEDHLVAVVEEDNFLSILYL